MNGWMIVWMSVLSFSVLTFAVLVLGIGLGAIRDLKESLQELSTHHFEDEPIPPDEQAAK